MVAVPPVTEVRQHDHGHVGLTHVPYSDAGVFLRWVPPAPGYSSTALFLDRVATAKPHLLDFATILDVAVFKAEEVREHKRDDQRRH